MMKLRKIWKLLKKDPSRAYLKYLDTLPLEDAILVNADLNNHMIENLKATGKQIWTDMTDPYRKLASARYVITDHPLPPFFIKREGQQILYMGKEEGRLKDYVQADVIVTSDPDSFARSYPVADISETKLLPDVKTGLDVLLDHKFVPSLSGNGKENVLIYTGNLTKNGITSSLLSLLDHLDLSKRNYYVTYRAKNVEDHKEILKELPKGVFLFPIEGNMNGSRKEKIELRLYRKNIISAKKAESMLDHLFRYEGRRMWGSARFDHVIQFSGYDYPMIHTMARMPHSNRVIFVHNDMVQEAKSRNAAHIPTLEYAYSHYDKVAAVTKDIVPTLAPVCKDMTRVHVADNTIYDKRIKAMGMEPMVFDEETESTHSLEEVKSILADHKVITTIGRFSPEKGHGRLMDAFDSLYKKDPSLYLMIIGGHGKEYEKTLSYGKSKVSASHIIIIKNLRNPQPFLKASAGFILPSYYEGLGLVLMEAIIQKVPVASTDIPGPRGFMHSVNGTLVPDSEAGVLEGLSLLANGKIPVLPVDFDAYNRKAVNEFEELLREEP